MSEQIQSVRFYDDNGDYFTVCRVTDSVVVHRDGVGASPDLQHILTLRNHNVCRMLGQVLVGFADDLLQQY